MVHFCSYGGNLNLNLLTNLQLTKIPFQDRASTQLKETKMHHIPNHNYNPKTKLFGDIIKLQQNRSFKFFLLFL